MKIAVLTSGGDAPGMNAAIRAVVRSAIYAGMEAYGVRAGFEGLLQEDIELMNAGSVADIIHRGGTILRTSRSEDFHSPEGMRQASENLHKRGIQHLVVIGGNGSLRGAYELSRLDIKVLGIPGTIDNDIVYTRSIGFDTAVNTVLEAINRIRDTASSHGRNFIIEVMGRNCGEIALAAGVAGGAESILIPELEVDVEQVVEKINRGAARGKIHSIILVAEGVFDVRQLKETIEVATGHDTRISILGHVQRGGSPTAFDRILASAMGKYAVDLIMEDQCNRMVASDGNHHYSVPLHKVMQGNKPLDLNMSTIAHILSI